MSMISCTASLPHRTGLVLLIGYMLSLGAFGSEYRIISSTSYNQYGMIAVLRSASPAASDQRYFVLDIDLTEKAVSILYSSQEFISILPGSRPDTLLLRGSRGEYIVRDNVSDSDLFCNKKYFNNKMIHSVLISSNLLLSADNNCLFFYNIGTREAHCAVRLDNRMFGPRVGWVSRELPNESVAIIWREVDNGNVYHVCNSVSLQSREVHELYRKEADYMSIKLVHGTSDFFIVSRRHSHGIVSIAFASWRGSRNEYTVNRVALDPPLLGSEVGTLHTSVKGICAQADDRLLVYGSCDSDKVLVLDQELQLPEGVEVLYVSQEEERVVTWSPSGLQFFSWAGEKIERIRTLWFEDLGDF